MVNQIDTEVFASDSESPSASSDHRFEVNGILGCGCGEFQDTEPIDEAIVIDSSLRETPFQNLYEDTELVDNGNCSDEEALDLEFEGLDEVVDDSEDEDEDEGTGSVAPAQSICLREPNPKAAGVLLESDGSNDHQCQTGAVSYTSELLLNGIVIQKLEYASHGLFPVVDKRNQRNTRFSTRIRTVEATTWWSSWICMIRRWWRRSIIIRRCCATLTWYGSHSWWPQNTIMWRRG